MKSAAIPFKEDYIIHWISRIRETVHDKMVAEYTTAGLEKIVPAHGAVLFALKPKSTPSMQELAWALSRDNSTITTLVNKLELLGYVKKEQAPEDRRIYRVTLTEQGSSARSKIISVSRKVLTKMFRGTKKAERRELMRLLSVIYNNLEEE